MNAIFLLLTTAVSAGYDPAPVHAVPHAPNGCCGAVSDCCEPSCCEPCCKKPSCLDRLRSLCRRSKPCCEPTCCDTCAPTSCCGAVADCGCEPCCKKPSCMDRLRALCHRRKDCCAPACDTCGDCGHGVIEHGAPGHCPNCAPAAPAPHGAGIPAITSIPSAPGPIPHGIPSTAPSVPAPQSMPSAPLFPSTPSVTPSIPSIPATGAPVAPPVIEKGPESIKAAPKIDSGKGAMLQSSPILTPTTAKVETEAKNPFEFDRRHDKRVSRAADYSNLTGQLSYVHVDGGLWVLRYASLGSEDKHGGSVILARDRNMNNYREGDLVSVEGQIINEKGSTKLGGPLYQVRNIRLVDRPQQ